MIKYTKKMPEPRARARKTIGQRLAAMPTKSMVGASILVMVMVALFTYVVQINSLAEQGFEVRTLEDQIVELQEKNKAFELQTVQLRSMAKVNEGIQQLGLVEASNIHYLDAQGVAFAQR